MASDEEAELRKTLEARIAAFRAGEDNDLIQVLSTLWTALYDRIPDLTGSRHKEDQHRLLEEFLVRIGLPACPDLQYVAGPILWYAREKGVIPPAQTENTPRESWPLDESSFSAARKTLQEGAIAYGDWMRDALRAILLEQR